VSEAQAGGERPRLALHVCCGPCASAVIERLAEDYDVIAVWYNPNIDPPAEHDRRLEGMRRVAELSGVPLVELAHDPEAWAEACAGLMDEPEGGARCGVCFRLRLQRVARWAAEGGISALATTLTVSPHKSAARINAIGQAVCRDHRIAFVAEDFKQRDGFRRSVELSREWGIYRQTWCGCAPAREGVGRGPG